MKFSELRRMVAEAQAALEEERALKVSKLREQGSKLNKIALRVELPEVLHGGTESERARVAIAEEKAVQRFIGLLLTSGVLERRTELTHFGSVSVLTYTLLVGTDKPTDVGNWREVR